MCFSGIWLLWVFGFDFDLRVMDLDNWCFYVFLVCVLMVLRFLCMFKVGWVSWDFCNLCIFLPAGCLGCVSVCLRFVVLFGFDSLLVFGWWVSYLLFGFWFCWGDLFSCVF